MIEKINPRLKEMQQKKAEIDDMEIDESLKSFLRKSAGLSE